MHHRDSKQSDIAMVCYLDLCKAAIFLPPSIEASSLRSIAPELADELRSRIMSPPQAFKPFYESADAIDVNLYADILVAIFRFNPTEAMESTFVACLANERSDAVKTCVVRAMVTLVSESKRFEAQPPIEPLYSRFANALREIFLVSSFICVFFIAKKVASGDFAETRTGSFKQATLERRGEARGKEIWHRFLQ